MASGQPVSADPRVLAAGPAGRIKALIERLQQLGCPEEAGTDVLAPHAMGGASASGMPAGGGARQEHEAAGAGTQGEEADALMGMGQHAHAVEQLLALAASL